MKKILILFFLCPLLVLAQKTILHCGKLIEPQKLQIVNEISIIIEGNKIVDVQKGYIKADLSDKVIDLKNKVEHIKDVEHIKSELNSLVEEIKANV